MCQVCGNFGAHRISAEKACNDRKAPVYTSEHKELLTGSLRDEWGFDGIVTTDWWTFGEHYRETKAGNDIKMAAGYPERIKEAYEKGFITEEEIRRSARRILNMILKID